MFKESIAKTEGDPAPGDVVRVTDEKGRFLGKGFFNPRSQLAVRIFARDEETEADGEFFLRRIANAARLRDDTLGLPVVTDVYRLVYSEGDLLPGLVVDHFAGHLVVQFSTLGMHLRRGAILDALEEVVRPRSIHELPDPRACEREGIEATTALLRGAEPTEPPSVLENGICFRIGLGDGQKTGFFADQRDNRELIGRCARDRTVLDLHTYSGGFALYAATNGAAEVLGIDSSGPALALAAENAMLNNVGQVRFERANDRDALNRMHQEGRTFDLVVCDPPPFARDRRDVDRALRGYRDLHLRAARVVQPGGLLAISCCSAAVKEADFEATLREAAFDLGRAVQILHRGGQAADHPVLGSCPETRYLKFLLACVT